MITYCYQLLLYLYECLLDTPMQLLRPVKKLLKISLIAKNKQKKTKLQMQLSTLSLQLFGHCIDKTKPFEHKMFLTLKIFQISLTFNRLTRHPSNQNKVHLTEPQRLLNYTFTGYSRSSIWYSQSSTCGEQHEYFKMK